MGSQVSRPGCEVWITDVLEAERLRMRVHELLRDTYYWFNVVIVEFNFPKGMLYRIGVFVMDDGAVANLLLKTNLQTKECNAIRVYPNHEVRIPKPIPCSPNTCPPCIESLA